MRWHGNLCPAYGPPGAGAIFVFFLFLYFYSSCDEFSLLRNTNAIKVKGGNVSSPSFLRPFYDTPNYFYNTIYEQSFLYYHPKRPSHATTLKYNAKSNLVRIISIKVKDEIDQY